MLFSFHPSEAFLNCLGLQAVCLLHIKKKKKPRVVEHSVYCYWSVAIFFNLNTIRAIAHDQRTRHLVYKVTGIHDISTQHSGANQLFQLQQGRETTMCFTDPFNNKLYNRKEQRTRKRSPNYVSYGLIWGKKNLLVNHRHGKLLLQCLCSNTLITSRVQGPCMDSDVRHV